MGSRYMLQFLARQKPLHCCSSSIYAALCRIQTSKQCSAECHCLLQEALWRVAAFADAGADVLFIDALESRDEMRALCSAGGSAASLPKVHSYACGNLSLAGLRLLFISG